MVRNCFQEPPEVSPPVLSNLPSTTRSGIFKRGGVAEGGFHTAVRGIMFVRNGAMAPGPSCECDITFFVKGGPNSAQHLCDSAVAVRRAQASPYVQPIPRVAPRVARRIGFSHKLGG